MSIYWSVCCQTLMKVFRQHQSSHNSTPKANIFKKYIISAPNSGCQTNPVKRRISIKVVWREAACRWSCNLLVGGGCHSNSRDGWSMELPRLMDDTQQHAAETGRATELQATHHNRSHRGRNYVCWLFCYWLLKDNSHTAVVSSAFGFSRRRDDCCGFLNEGRTQRPASQSVHSTDGLICRLFGCWFDE